MPGEAVPTQCWQIHEDVRIIQFLVPFSISSHDLVHDNLLNVERLEIDYATSIADDALRLLTKVTYLSITESNITRLPDLSSQTAITSLEASHSNLVSAPSLTHMTQLNLVSLHHNYIQHLAYDFLPDAEGTVGMTLVHNSFTELNASSIVQAPPLSSFVFDQLEVVWATLEEKDTIIAKNFYCNIDLLSIVHIIDDPTNP